MIPEVIVIGAGPAGLTVSRELLRCGVSTLCLERAERAGGMLRTVVRDGFLAEAGPHSMRVTGGELPRALAEAGLRERAVAANPEAAKRYITRGGKPVEGPSGPLEALTTPLLSLTGKLRLAAEPFIGREGANTEESVADFLRRRVGREVLDRLADAVTGGIYAGDPEELTLRHAFPSLHRWESVHGSLLKGLWAERAERRAAGTAKVVSFRGGMGEAAQILADGLGQSLRLRAQVTGISRRGSCWSVRWREEGGEELAAVARSVVFATAPFGASAPPLPAELARLNFESSAPRRPPVAVVTLGYARERVAHPLDGFGVLSPFGERRRAAGVLFASSAFPGRAPDGAVSLAIFLGGSRSPESARLPAKELAAEARRECEELLGATGAPEFVETAKWEHAIPQYGRNQTAHLALLDEAESAAPGLHFCGNHRGGVSLPSTLDNASETAKRILRSRA